MYQSLKRNNNLYREFSLPNFVCAQGFQNKKKKKFNTLPKNRKYIKITKHFSQNFIFFQNYSVEFNMYNYFEISEMISTKLYNVYILSGFQNWNFQKIGLTLWYSNRS